MNSFISSPSSWNSHSRFNNFDHLEFPHLYLGWRFGKFAQLSVKNVILVPVNHGTVSWNSPTFLIKFILGLHIWTFQLFLFTSLSPSFLHLSDVAISHSDICLRHSFSIPTCAEEANPYFSRIDAYLCCFYTYFSDHVIVCNKYVVWISTQSGGKAMLSNKNVMISWHTARSTKCVKDKTGVYVSIPMKTFNFELD